MEPIIPFEPVRTEKFPSGKNWVAQVKWDGVRVLTYWDGSEVRLFNRKKNERTGQFPELTEIRKYCKASSVILDGEVIALEKGKPSFHKVMKRDGLRNLNHIHWARRNIPIMYMVFDLLYCNGKWVADRPLRERQKILEEIIQAADSIYPVENFQDAEALFKAIQEQAMEGIVCKDLESLYLIGGKDLCWQKIKNYQDQNAVIGGITLRGNVVNALLLGAYDFEGRLWYIGHAGAGKFTQKDWVCLTQKLLPLKQKRSPFYNQPARLQGAVWVKPWYTVRVKFLEWTEGGTLRQPSLQALLGVAPESCLLE